MACNATTAEYAGTRAASRNRNRKNSDYATSAEYRKARAMSGTKKRPRELRIEQADPRKLNPAAYNPRKISARKMALLRRSIVKFGFVDPVQVRRAGDLIIGGHQRVKAAGLGNIKKVPGLRFGILDAQAKLLKLALNAANRTADVPKLSFLFQKLKTYASPLEL